MSDSLREHLLIASKFPRNPLRSARCPQARKRWPEMREIPTDKPVVVELGPGTGRLRAPSSAHPPGRFLASS